MRHSSISSGIVKILCVVNEFNVVSNSLILVGLLRHIAVVFVQRNYTVMLILVSRQNYIHFEHFWRALFNELTELSQFHVKILTIVTILSASSVHIKQLPGVYL